MHIPIAPLAENRFEIVEAAKAIRASGQTALYDAIKAGIEMTDDARGSSDAIRGLVDQGNTCLHDIVKTITEDEIQVDRF